MKTYKEINELIMEATKDTEVFIVQKRTSNQGLWSVVMKVGTERMSIIKADQFKKQHPKLIVRVIDNKDNLIYQA